MNPNKKAADNDDFNQCLRYFLRKHGLVKITNKYCELNNITNRKILMQIM